MNTLLLHTEQPGFLSTLQDGGRHSHRSSGVTTGGALEPFAPPPAHLLGGNNPEGSGLEMTQAAHRFRLAMATVLALCGGGLQPELDGKVLPFRQAVWAPAGSVLTCNRPRPGFRLYLAVAGGFAADSFLGSRSTDLQIIRGGYQGRALQKGDQLHRAHPPTALQEQLAQLLQEGSTLQFPVQGPDYAATTIRATPGPEWTELPPAAWDAIRQNTCTIGLQSNRMGYRLSGLPQAPNMESMISAPVTPGTLQLTPAGEGLLLMADGQTVGGYPRVLQAIRADLPILAQKKPGDAIRWQLVDVAAAERLYLEREAALSRLQQTIQRLHAD